MKGRWSNNTYIVQGTVVGTISEVGPDWYAYGCLDEWEDTALGIHPTRETAQRSVQEWVRTKATEKGL